MFWTTIENQLRPDGSFGLLYDHWDTEAKAMAKFYRVCAEASVSECLYHSVHILASDGRIVRQEIFDRRNENEA